MHRLADELNGILEGTVAGRLLSGLGRRLYFPRGIVAQAAEARSRATFANGTIGMAYSNGRPMILSAIADGMATLSPEESVAYAPTAGIEKARVAWRDLMIRKNPSLDPGKMSLPVVVAGLTCGLSCTADMFTGNGSSIITSDPCWDNYSLIFDVRRNATLVSVPFFDPGGGLNVDAIRSAVTEMAKTGTVRILLNFPNNPSGYSPSPGEGGALAEIIDGAARGGADVLVLCDDSYFGLFYEDGTEKESLFVRFAGLHERVLAVKIDGPIKEDFAWGLRIAFLTFASKGLGGPHYDALVTKLSGAIRSSVSCSGTSAQHLMLKAMEDPRTPVEKAAFGETLLRRYRLVRDFVEARAGHPVLRPLPFNSGYFMSFLCGVDAQALRRELLSRHGIGLVSLGENCLRIAFSGIDEGKIVPLLGIVYETAEKMAGGEF